jgi:hypothetical protein
VLSEALGTVSLTYLPYLNDDGIVSNQESEPLRGFRRVDKWGREARGCGEEHEPHQSRKMRFAALTTSYCVTEI